MFEVLKSRYAVWKRYSRTVSELEMLSTRELAQKLRELNLDDQERRVLNLVTIDPIAVDDVLRTAGFEASRVLATLTVLEMRRLVRRVPGGQVCRVL